MKPLYKRYNEQKPVGIYGTYFGVGYLFFEPIDDDKFECDFVICYERPSLSDPRGYTRENYRRHNVYYTTSGRAYVNIRHWRVYLNEVMRTNGYY